jgi:hypothetical protein
MICGIDFWGSFCGKKIRTEMKTLVCIMLENMKESQEEETIINE